ncbi:MAG: YfiR family protein [Burkholderiales bacterium]
MTARRLLFVVALCLALPSWAQPQATDVQVKAAFLYKFGAFVEWPPKAFAQPSAAFTIGVLGADAVAEELEQISAGRSVHGRPVAVRRLQRGTPLDGLHVLFVGRTDPRQLADILAAARSQPLLIVTDAADGLPEGSIINFVPVDNKLRFDIAVATAERMQLRISARLLAVARKVLPG